MPEPVSTVIIVGGSLAVNAYLEGRKRRELRRQETRAREERDRLERERKEREYELEIVRKREQMRDNWYLTIGTQKNPENLYMSIQDPGSIRAMQEMFAAGDYEGAARLGEAATSNEIDENREFIEQEKKLVKAKYGIYEDQALAANATLLKKQNNLIYIGLGIAVLIILIFVI